MYPLLPSAVAHQPFERPRKEDPLRPGAGNKHTCLVQDTGSGRSCAWNSPLSGQFCCEPKTASKKLVCFYKVRYCEICGVLNNYQHKQFINILPTLIILSEFDII